MVNISGTIVEWFGECWRKVLTLERSVICFEIVELVIYLQERTPVIQRDGSVGSLPWFQAL